MTSSSGIENQYIKLVSDLGGVLAARCVPVYGSRFSRRDFTVHQHIVLLVLRARERKPFRDFCEWLGVALEIRKALKLRRIPHYTTLQKQAASLPPRFLEQLVAWVGKKAADSSEMVAVDATGFSLDCSSHYYCKRIQRLDKYRNYLKTSIVGDMDTQVILGARLRLKRRHDNIDFVPLLRKTRRRIMFNTVVADKAYDSEDNLAFVETELKATPIIPPKYQDKPPDKTRGVRRQQLKANFPQQTYNQRNKIETIISVIKRCYGSTIHSRTHRTQKNELLLKLIAYNLRKITQQIETLW
ncbi:MAG: IS5 family transposase [Candidatus Altiarchaeota archaeon]